MTKKLALVLAILMVLGLCLTACQSTPADSADPTKAPDNTYTFTWNLCGAAGQPLKTGVYLYRIIVASPTGQSESKAQKMLIRR